MSKLFLRCFQFKWKKEMRLSFAAQKANCYLLCTQNKGEHHPSLCRRSHTKRESFLFGDSGSAGFRRARSVAQSIISPRIELLPLTVLKSNRPLVSAMFGAEAETTTDIMFTNWSFSYGSACQHHRAVFERNGTQRWALQRKHASQSS